MLKTKLLTGVLLVLAVLFAQVGTALAAPAAQDTTSISGTVDTITTETVNGVTTVVVTYTDSESVQHTIHLSLEAAVAEGLITWDQTTDEVVLVAQPGDTLDVDPANVLPDEQPADEAVHPIAALLAKFFNVEPSVVQGYHEDGFGFGVIAQAMWMAKGLSEGEDSVLVDAGLILQAKKTGDYSAFALPDGTTPSNWGQFKKALTGKDKKNLGVIVSGHATTDESQQIEQNNGHGNGKGNGKDNNPGKGKDKNKP